MQDAFLLVKHDRTRLRSARDIRDGCEIRSEGDVIGFGVLWFRPDKAKREEYVVLVVGLPILVLLCVGNLVLR